MIASYLADGSVDLDFSNISIGGGIAIAAICAAVVGVVWCLGRWG